MKLLKLDWLESEDFDRVMYAYRSAPTSDRAWVIRSFEAVKQYIRDQVPEIDAVDEATRIFVESTIARLNGD